LVELVLRRFKEPSVLVGGYMGRYVRGGDAIGSGEN
jgi:hypothetical protein